MAIKTMTTKQIMLTVIGTIAGTAACALIIGWKAAACFTAAVAILLMAELYREIMKG